MQSNTIKNHDANAESKTQSWTKHNISAHQNELVFAVTVIYELTIRGTECLGEARGKWLSTVPIVVKINRQGAVIFIRTILYSILRCALMLTYNKGLENYTSAEVKIHSPFQSP
jgi:hypothetical protein